MNTRRAKHLKKIATHLFALLPKIENEQGEYVVHEFRGRFISRDTLYRALKRRWSDLSHRDQGAYTERVTLGELRKILDRTPTPPVHRDPIALDENESQRKTRTAPTPRAQSKSKAVESARRILRRGGDR